MRLGDGAHLNLTVFAMVDRTGRVHDGAIMPDEVQSSSGGGNPAADALVDRATARLVGQATCRR